MLVAGLAACSANDAPYAACAEAVLDHYDSDEATITEDNAYAYGEGEVLSTDDFYTVASSMLIEQYTLTIWNVLDPLEVPTDMWTAENEAIAPTVREAILAEGGESDPELWGLVVTGPAGDTGAFTGEWQCADFGDGVELVSKRIPADTSATEVANFIHEAVYPETVTNTEWLAGEGGGRD